MNEKTADEWTPKSYPIPPHWEHAVFDDCFGTIPTTGLKIPQKEYAQSGTYPVIDQGADLIGGYTDDGTKIIHVSEPVLVFGDHTKCLKFIRQDFAPGADGIQILAPLGHEPKYLYYLYFSLRLPDRGYSRHFSFLKRSKFPIAPLNEQRRIVEKIENLFAELDKGEESLRAAKAQAGLYRQSLLKHAFEGHLTADWRAANPDKLENPDTLLARIRAKRDARYRQALADWQEAMKKWRDDGEEGKKPAKPKRPSQVSIDEVYLDVLPTLPDSWALEHLGNLNVDIFDGPFGSNLKTSDYTESGVQVVRLENIGYGNFVQAKLSFVSEEKYESLKKHTVYPRDIVVSSFVIDGIRSTLIPSNIPFAVNKADCFAIQIFGSSVLNEYLAQFLQSRWAYKAVEGLIHGVGRPRINTTQLKEVQVPVCSPDEQAEIVSRLEAKLSTLDALENDLDTQLAHSKALRQSILKRAFSGQLVPQDPTDEPASKLLERIKAEKAETAKKAKSAGPKQRVREPKPRRITMADLIAALRDEKDWVSAEVAARRLGIADGATSDAVEAFYRDLRAQLENGKVEVERRGDADWLRLAPEEVA